MRACPPPRAQGFPIPHSLQFHESREQARRNKEASGGEPGQLVNIALVCMHAPNLTKALHPIVFYRLWPACRLASPPT